MIVIILILTGVQVASASTQVTHHLEQKFQALMTPSDYLDKHNVKSDVDCARICALDNLCTSLFYIIDNRLCQTHTQKYTTADIGLVVHASALYYEKEDNAATTTPAMTTTTTATTAEMTTTTTTATTTTTTTTTAPTTPTVFTCPPDDTTFRAVTLSDGTQFSYRVFKDTPRTDSQAITKCNTHGSTLWEVVTIPKFNFTQQLMACPAYAAFDFWTNGVYNAYTSTWESLTGKPIPMTSDFWYPDRPNSGGSSPCVYMESIKGHYLDDYPCNSPDKDIYIICEILL